MACSFISKMPSTGLIMGIFEKIMNLIFSDTTLDLLIQPNVENTSFNPGILGTLLNNALSSSW